MPYQINKTCLACRKLISNDDNQELLAFIPLTTKYNKKTSTLNGATKVKEVDVLCPTCRDRMLAIIQEQKSKGIKVL